MWKIFLSKINNHFNSHVIFIQDKEPTGIIPLENLQVRENNDIRRKVIKNNLQPI